MYVFVINDLCDRSWLDRELLPGVALASRDVQLRTCRPSIIDHGSGSLEVYLQSNLFASFQAISSAAKAVSAMDFERISMATISLS